MKFTLQIAYIYNLVSFDIIIYFAESKNAYIAQG